MKSGLPSHWYHSAYHALARSMMNAAYQNLVDTGQLTPDNAFTSLMIIIDILNGEINQQGRDMAASGNPCLLRESNVN